MQTSAVARHNSPTFLAEASLTNLCAASLTEGLSVTNSQGNLREDDTVTDLNEVRDWASEEVKN